MVDSRSMAHGGRGQRVKRETSVEIPMELHMDRIEYSTNDQRSKLVHLLEQNGYRRLGDATMTHWLGHGHDKPDPMIPGEFGVIRYSRQGGAPVPDIMYVEFERLAGDKCDYRVEIK